MKQQQQQQQQQKGKGKGKNVKLSKGKKTEEKKYIDNDDDDDDEEFEEEQEDPENLSLVIEENNSESEKEEEEKESSESEDEDENSEDDNDDDDDDDDVSNYRYDDDSDDEDEKPKKGKKDKKGKEEKDSVSNREVMTSSKLIRSKLSKHKTLVLKSAEDNSSEEPEIEEISKDSHTNNNNDDDDNDSLIPINSDNENEEERPEDEEYFEKATTTTSSSNCVDGNDDTFIIPFEEMNLSKGMLRSIKSMGYTKPTPIQSAAIGIALAGKDLCANAATGSGKTAAFLIPIIERLGRSSNNNNNNVVNTSSARCVILTPTRELAAQCETVFEKLSPHTNLTHVLIVGGVASTTQLKYLQGGVDVVIATPGRLIDHVLNSPSVIFKNTEILVLDEADQLLDMDFLRQVEEISKACSSKERRQTLLFSATMTAAVDKLAKLALHKPVWLSVDRKFDMNKELTHELIRLPESESNNKDDGNTRYATRVAYLLALCKTQLRTKTLIFCASKLSAHRVMLYMTLAGFAVADLHGNQTHVQRMAALHKFRAGEVDFLVSTDLAARGLDIEGVTGVINFQLPYSLCRYVHRVGRTARAGKAGRAISLVGHQDSILLRQVVNHSKGKVVKRKVPDVFITKCVQQVKDTTADVDEIIKLEADEKANNEAMRDVTRAENLIIHREEILSHPKKTWFMSRAEKRKLEAEEREEARKKRKLEAEAAKAQKDGHKQARVKKEMAREQKIKERQKMKEERELRAAYRSAKMAKRESHHAKKAPEGRNNAKAAGSKKSDKKRTKQMSQKRSGDNDSGVKKPKLHLGKKKSSNQFKSKKRFKRR